MIKSLTRALKQTAIAGAIAASAIYSSGCANMLDPRCKDKNIYVTSSEDYNGGVDIQLVSVGFGNKVLQKGTTPCYMMLYRSGDNISGANAPAQPAIGNYVISATKKNVSEEDFKKNPHNYVDLKRINYKLSPFLVFDLFFPVALFFEAALGGGKYYEEDSVHFDFNAPSSERQNKFNVNFRK